MSAVETLERDEGLGVQVLNDPAAQGFLGVLVTPEVDGGDLANNPQERLNKELLNKELRRRLPADFTVEFHAAEPRIDPPTRDAARGRCRPA